MCGGAATWGRGREGDGAVYASDAKRGQAGGGRAEEFRGVARLLQLLQLAAPLTVNEEKPRSRVMPRSRLWGFLSSAAVDRVVDRAATGAAAQGGGGGDGSRVGWQSGGRRCKRGMVPWLLKARHTPREVFPESTCPRTPTFTLSVAMSEERPAGAAETVAAAGAVEMAAMAIGSDALYPLLHYVMIQGPLATCARSSVKNCCTRERCSPTFYSHDPWRFN